jgi:hypothetical protein
MALDNTKNFAKGTLVGTYTSSATVLNLASGQGARFPAALFNVIVWNKTTYGDPADDPLREIMRVTAINGDQFTVVRGQETSDGGLTASAKDVAGATYGIALILSTKTMKDLAAAAVDVGMLTVYVTERGAKGDGVTDDTAAIQQAITDGNDVVFPPGTWMISGEVNVHSNLTIRGAGIGVTTIKLMNNSGVTNMFEAPGGVSGLTIRDLTIDGNEAQNASAFDVFKLAGIERSDFQNVQIKSVRRVGVSIGSGGGSVKYVRFRSCIISDCRSHNVEIENRNNNNFGILFSDCTFSAPGFGGASAKAAIMAFGMVQVQNCVIDGVAGDNYGLWLRADDGTLGLGAHGSNISNVHINGSVAGGTVSEGVRCEANNCVFHGVHVDSCDRGYHVGVTSNGDDNAFIGCRAIGAGDAGWYIEGDRNRIDDCYTTGHTVGIDIRSTAADTTISSSYIAGTTKVANAGTTTHARGNLNWKTQAVLQTSDINMFPGAGMATQAIAHGLDVTPAKENCNVSLAIITAPAGTGSASIGGPHVHAVDATNVTVSWAIRVATADSTGVVRVTVVVDALP